MIKARAGGSSLLPTKMRQKSSTKIRKNDKLQQNITSENTPKKIGYFYNKFLMNEQEAKEDSDHNISLRSVDNDENKLDLSMSNIQMLNSKEKVINKSIIDLHLTKMDLHNASPQPGRGMLKKNSSFGGSNFELSKSPYLSNKPEGIGFWSEHCKSSLRFNHFVPDEDEGSNSDIENNDKQFLPSFVLQKNTQKYEESGTDLQHDQQEFNRQGMEKAAEGGNTEYEGFFSPIKIFEDEELSQQDRINISRLPKIHKVSSDLYKRDTKPVYCGK